MARWCSELIERVRDPLRVELGAGFRGLPRPKQPAGHVMTDRRDIADRLRDRDDRISWEAVAEIERLRSALSAWEAIAAIARGSLQRTPDAEPDTICNVSTLVPPSAPPYGEPKE